MKKVPEMTGEEELQADLIRAFAAGEVKGAPAPVEQITTHLSHVFLSGERAIKFKRAVTLPFVDFASLSKRRDACEAEIAVNRVMAAELYVGAQPISLEAGGFVLGGKGEPVEWAVVMRRFDQAQQFDRLAKAGALTREAVEAVSAKLARAHAAAPGVKQAGYAAHYRQIIHELRAVEAHGAGALGLSAGAPTLFEALDQELVRIGHLIEARRRAGKVRRGHGDLHLRNVCIWNDTPLAFDALEFDDALATSDVLYDLAFLLMDLRRAGLIQHANAAMNRYWDAAGEDDAALALLPFFMALRAAVRMAVAVEAGALTEAQDYRVLGLEILKRHTPCLFAIGGLSGTGKSAVAQMLAACASGPAGARLLRSDVLRKTRAGLALGAKAGQASYTPEQRRQIYRDLARRAAEALAGGASVIADATFIATSAQEAVEASAGRAPFQAYWLSAPLKVRLGRIVGRAHDASDADAAVATAQKEPALLSRAWRRTNADRPVMAIVAEIMDELRGHIC